MIKFEVTKTPIELATYTGDVEEIEVTWKDGKLVLQADTESPEGYSVPVRLTVDAALVERLRREITRPGWET